MYPHHNILMFVVIISYSIKIHIILILYQAVRTTIIFFYAVHAVMGCDPKDFVINILINKYIGYNVTHGKQLKQLGNNIF